MRLQGTITTTSMPNGLTSVRGPKFNYEGHFTACPVGPDGLFLFSHYSSLREFLYVFALPIILDGTRVNQNQVLEITQMNCT